MKYEFVKRDDQFWKENMEGPLVKFYNNCLLLELVDRRYARVLVMTDSVDWKCKVCSGTRPKRLSGIIPDDENDYKGPNSALNQAQEAIRIIREQVKEVIKDEL
ncbi:unnamed protein product [Euphydryas editha]|uniref:Uncharacterized protein n=1 Tax=Euphydryas editha TaxID=104508 RepID=A0AAU9TT04_EUPED|nr:unnamed protein product [Euphydryas editha]